MFKIILFAILEISSQIRENSLIWSTHCMSNTDITQTYLYTWSTSENFTSLATAFDVSLYIAYAKIKQKN